MAEQNSKVYQSKMDMGSEEIKAAIIAMTASITAEDRKRYGDVVDAIEAKYKDHNMDPEIFATLITYDITEKINEQAALRFFPQYADNRSIMFVIKNYNFVNEHLSRIIAIGHGTSVCCVDCSRWLIKEYIKHLEDETYIPDMTIGEDCYWKPNFGSGEEWMTMCKAIEHLYWSHVPIFWEARERLLKVATEVNGGK